MAHASVHVSDERIKGAEGLRLFVRSWRPNGKASGAVAIIPGFNSHSGYYTWTGEQFAASGLAVYAVDLHGRGHSDGERFMSRSLPTMSATRLRLSPSLRSASPDCPYSCAATAPVE